VPGHSHSHDHELDVEPRLARTLNAIVIVIAVVTVFGAAVLWPSGEAQNDRQQVRFEYPDATLTTITPVECPGLTSATTVTCRLLEAKLTSGSRSGETVLVYIQETDPVAALLAAGDGVVLTYNAAALEDFRFQFVDYQRGSSLWILVILFVIVVVALSRWHGVRALAALAISLFVLMAGVLPSLLRGNDAVQVALVGAALVGFVALYLTNGINMASTVALLGTFAALIVTATLAWIFTDLAKLTGLTDDAQQTLRFTASGVNLRDLIIAGSVIGALGVLDDVTVTQVSAVTELRRANPSLNRRELYGAALRIGRDHVASTINTLVLAYAGASLPLLLIYVQADTPLGRVLGTEVVATEIIRTLVGTIGLVISVPITTALAAAVIAPRMIRQHDPEPDDTPPSPRWEDFAPEG